MNIKSCILHHTVRYKFQRTPRASFKIIAEIRSQRIYAYMCLQYLESNNTIPAA